jgi:hypothetical protein
MPPTLTRRRPPAPAAEPTLSRRRRPAPAAEPIPAGGVQLQGAIAWTPLAVAVGWLLGTFALFWLGDLAGLVPNPVKLWTFVLAATGAFAAGYAMRIRKYPRGLPMREVTPAGVGAAGRLITWSAWYFIVLSVALLNEYGATGIGSIWDSILHPDLAYAGKFEIYELQQEFGRTSWTIRILTLLGALSTVLVPYLVVFWRTLSTRQRQLGVFALALYASYFLFIGTMKGLGDTVVLVVGGVMIATCARRSRTPSRRGRYIAMLAAVGATFSLYMVYGQAARAQYFGTEAFAPPNPVVASLAGDRFATGLAVMVRYPTHGYLGLAYNLDTPFTWAGGAGSSPALASYAEQYLGADAGRTLSYPARTEARTGWPSGMYWATIYPWLASDLTFPGTVAFMGVLGWFFARVWVESVATKRGLPILLFTQLCIVLAYVPANNQIGTSRLTLIGVGTLLALYLYQLRTDPDPVLYPGSRARSRETAGAMRPSEQGSRWRPRTRPRPSSCRSQDRPRPPASASRRGW